MRKYIFESLKIVNELTDPGCTWDLSDSIHDRCRYHSMVSPKIEICDHQYVRTWYESKYS